MITEKESEWKQKEQQLTERTTSHKAPEAEQAGGFSAEIKPASMDFEFISSTLPQDLFTIPVSQGDEKLKAQVSEAESKHEELAKQVADLRSQLDRAEEEHRRAFADKEAETQALAEKLKQVQEQAVGADKLESVTAEGELQRK